MELLDGLFGAPLIKGASAAFNAALDGAFLAPLSKDPFNFCNMCFCAKTDAIELFDFGHKNIVVGFPGVVIGSGCVCLSKASLEKGPTID